MEQGNGRFVRELQRIGGFKMRLLEIPEALHTARRTLADADRTLAGLKKRVGEAKDNAKDSENELALEVAGLKTDFPNETARKTETQRRLKASAQHQALVKLVDVAETAVFTAEHERRLLELDVRKLEDEQRALQTYSDATVSESMLLAAGR
jgi:hypothetical protein